MLKKDGYVCSHKTSRLRCQKSVCCEYLHTVGYVCLVKNFLNSWEVFPLCELRTGYKVSAVNSHALCSTVQCHPQHPCSRNSSQSQRWFKKLSVGYLFYPLNSSAQDLPLSPPKRELHATFFGGICSWSDSASNNVLPIPQLIFIGFFLPLNFDLLIFFKIKCAVYITFNALPDKMLTAEEQLMTSQKPLKKSAPDWSVSGHIIMFWFLVHTGNEGEQDNIEFL